MTTKGIPAVLEEPIIIKVVPISADQLRALESLDTAFRSLYVDFQRDMGGSADDVAGCLFRLTSTLGAITSFWKEQAEDLATVESWRAALAQIRDERLDAFEAQTIAGEVLR